MWVKLDDLAPGQVVLDSRNDKGAGIVVTTAAGSTLRLDFSDGTHSGGWDSDAGLLEAGKLHHVVFVVDGGPKVITCVVDGALCDGGEHRQYGWGRFGRYDAKRKSAADVPGDVTGGPRLRIAPKLSGELRLLRIYDRYLRTSEAIANFRGGMAAETSR